MLLTCCLRHTEVLFKEANTNLNHDNFIDLRENLFIHATFFHLHCFEKGFPWKMCFSLTTMVEPMYTLVPRPLALVCARVERRICHQRLFTLGMKRLVQAFFVPVYQRTIQFA